MNTTPPAFDRDSQPGAAEAAATLAWAFGRMAERWARERHAPEAAIEAMRAAAMQLSLATSAGHVCTPLEALVDGPAPGSTPGRSTDLPGLTRPASAARIAALRQALLGSGVVGTPQVRGAAPMILDADGRLYLHRYFDLEARLARALLARAGASGNASVRGRPDAVDLATAEASLQALIAQQFPAQPDVAGRIDWPQVATAMALTQRLTVVSGGPGTGKTTAVVKLLACLLAQQAGCRIALAAPTGKAAARMLEALRERAAGAALPDSIRAALPTQSYTLHRLLGLGGRRRPTPGADALLPFDALIVDEASMLDLALATRLFEAMPPQARIVLLGDKDQLAAVEAGAVFAELSATRRLGAAAAQRLGTLCGVAPALLLSAAGSDDSDGTGDGNGGDVESRNDSANGCDDSGDSAGRVAQAAIAPDSVVWFTEQFRFAADSGIGQLAGAVRSGNGPAALALLRSQAPGLRWADDGAPAPGELTLSCVAQGYAGYMAALAALTHAMPAATDIPEAERIAATMAAFDRFRVLCAVREGPRGVESVNRWMTQQVRRTAESGGGLAGDAASPWFPGRPVMIRRNDASLRVFNGDVGLCLPDRHGTLQVWFTDRAAGVARGQDRSRFRPIAPVRLPPHDTAFAITVHQSQGSEFDEVLVLMPDQPGRGVTRELLYTAVTRARREVTLAGPAPVLAQAIDTPTRRRSGLTARCNEAAACALTTPGSASVP